MNSKKQTEKNIPLMITTLVLFFLFGALTFFLVDKNKAINPDRVLNKVKRKFKEDGPIEGSWIEMTKVPWSKYSYDTEVYYGGLSRFVDGERVHYEFIADAHTGSVIDLYII